MEGFVLISSSLFRHALLLFIDFVDLFVRILIILLKNVRHLSTTIYLFFSFSLSCFFSHQIKTRKVIIVKQPGRRWKNIQWTHSFFPFVSNEQAILLITIVDLHFFLLLIHPLHHVRWFLGFSLSDFFCFLMTSVCTLEFWK